MKPINIYSRIAQLMLVNDSKHSQATRPCQMRLLEISTSTRVKEALQFNPWPFVNLRNTLAHVLLGRVIAFWKH